MSIRALHLAKKVISKQISPNSPVLDPNFITAKSFPIEFKDPERRAISNKTFFDLNKQETELLEEKNRLLKEVGPNIPWNYITKEVEEDAWMITSVRNIYNRIFGGDLMPKYDEYNPEEAKELEAQINSFPDFTEAVNKRASDLIDEIESEVNPFLNPFADFWIYEKDGPEFADIFAARPQWNKYINRRADEYAFEFTNGDPFMDPDQVSAINTKVNADMETFNPVGSPEEILQQAIDGRLHKSIMQHYEHTLEMQEDHDMKHFTDDDTAALAFRNGYITPESDPVAKRHGGH